jgi:uncharacterized protein YegL
MSESDISGVEYARNPDQRCPLVLVLDTSGSMDGHKIQELNEGLHQLRRELEEDVVARNRVEIAIVTFGHGCKVVQNFTNIANFSPPTLVAGGLTPMGEAMLMAFEIAEKQSDEYRRFGIPQYVPWIWLMSDGVPTSDISPAAQKAKTAVTEGRAVIIAVGMGTDALTEPLSQLSPGQPPLKLKEGCFKTMITWLSQSPRLRTKSGNITTRPTEDLEKLDLPTVETWADILT